MRKFVFGCEKLERVCGYNYGAKTSVPGESLRYTWFPYIRLRKCGGLIVIIMRFQIKHIALTVLIFSTAHARPGDCHDVCVRCISWPIFWSYLWTGATRCVSQLYINFISVQYWMRPTSVWNGCLQGSVCLSWWAVPRLQGWKCKLCYIGGWVPTDWSSPCQRWVVVDIQYRP